MKFSLFFFAIIFSCTAQSQDLYSNHLDAEDFFCEKGIEIDSCSYKPLYNEIHLWLNTPYKYAGLTKKGIDCSGLVKRIFERIYNTSLLGGSSNIFTQSALIEDKMNLREGD